MEHRVQLEHLTLAQAADLVAGITDRLAEGTLGVEGAEFRVTEPVQFEVELDASHTAARISITIQCHRPDGTSRLLQEELARPGG